MNQQQIEWIKALDRSQTNGTIMSVLLSDNLEVQQFEKVLKFLLTTTLAERNLYEEENKRFANILKENNLYTNQTVFGGE